ncbi:MAG: hypothetical protein HY600_00515 [Candidatus Omnitrophica bacterium]|nr:hypothetical protein [Candidatus Omnitrophota bacterium]
MIALVIAIVLAALATACGWAVLRAHSWRVRLLWVTLAAIYGAAGVACFALFGTLRTYQMLTRREVVATVECWPSPTRPDEYRLVYRPLVRGRPGPAQVFQLYGEAWSLSGHLLIWRGWASVAGAKTWYKITRLEGRYDDAARAQAAPRLVYDVNGGPDAFWRLLYRLQPWLPGVEAVYGDSVFMPVDPRKQFVVYAAPSGLFVKPQRRPPKYP